MAQHNPVVVDFRDCINAISKVGRFANQLALEAPIKRRNDGRGEVRYQAMANIQAFALASRLHLMSIVTTIRPASVLVGEQADELRSLRQQVFGDWGDWQLAESALELSSLFGFMTLFQFQIEAMLKRFASSRNHSLRRYVQDVVDPYHPGRTSNEVWAPFGVLAGFRNSFHNNGMVDRQPCSWTTPSGIVLKTEVGKVAGDVDFITVSELAYAILEALEPLVRDKMRTPEYDHNSVISLV
jgi:hypothetical protein